MLELDDSSCRLSMIGMGERMAEADFSEDELLLLDEILVATSSSRGLDREVALKLQTATGRALCRTVLLLRTGRRVVHAEEPEAVVHEGSKVIGEWPSGKWSDDVGRLAVSEFERSGLNEADFCRATGLSRGRIRGWVRRLRARS